MAALRVLLCVCALLNAATSDVISECELNVANNSVVREYESKLVLNDKYKNVVLVLGLSGAGMSTVTQWIAGNDTKVKSIEDSDEYIVIDNDKIGTTINSKTIYPELVIDKETDTAYYDVPGLTDTRGSKHEIATRHFIKKIIDHVDNVKILLVASQETVKRGGSTSSLIKLLKHFTNLVNDIEKYTNGIGIVITKVVNKYKKGNHEMISDETVIRNIVNHLSDVANDIKQIKESVETTDNSLFDDKVFCEKSIKTINSLLVLEGQTYKKMALFRAPNRVGLLKDMEYLEQEKQVLRNMVAKNLQFIPKQPDDFCYKLYNNK